MNKPLFKLCCVVHGYLVSFYMSRLGGEGGNALSCDVLSFRVRGVQWRDLVEFLLEVTKR